MIESEIEDKMRTMIEARGGKFIKFTSPSSSGVPDRLVLKNPGQIIFVELKRDGGKASAMQKRWNRVLRSYGFDARIVVGLKEAMKFIEEVFSE